MKFIKLDCWDFPIKDYILTNSVYKIFYKSISILFYQTRQPRFQTRLLWLVKYFISILSDSAVEICQVFHLYQTLMLRFFKILTFNINLIRLCFKDFKNIWLLFYQTRLLKYFQKKISHTRLLLFFKYLISILSYSAVKTFQKLQIIFNRLGYWKFSNILNKFSETRVLGYFIYI